MDHNANDEHEKASDVEAGNSDGSTRSTHDESLTDETKVGGTENILSGVKLATVVAALMLTILCVALDNTSQLF